VSDYAFDQNVISFTLDQSEMDYGLEGDSRGGQSSPPPVHQSVVARLVWPSTLLDYMRKQSKFRGRTKKGAMT